MRITEVTVCVHEKRNHPHEYGHYDCSVTLTGQTDEQEGADSGVVRLRERARAHVREECDGWIAGINRRYELDGLINRLGYASSIAQLELLLGELYLVSAALPDDEPAEVRKRAEGAYRARGAALAGRADAEMEDPTF